MNTEKVRCDKCGFLALRRIDDRQLVEADDIYRENATLPKSRYSEVEEYEASPICFATKADFGEEIKKQETKIPSNDILAVIQQERLCVGFTTWRRGSNPKEHMEMLDREKWRDWQRADRKWRIVELLILFAMSLVFLFIGLAIN